MGVHGLGVKQLDSSLPHGDRSAHAQPVLEILRILGERSLEGAKELERLTSASSDANVQDELCDTLRAAHLTTRAAADLRAFVSAYAHRFLDPRPVISALARAQDISPQGFVRRYSPDTVRAIASLLSPAPDVKVILAGLPSLREGDLLGVGIGGGAATRNTFIQSDSPPDRPADTADSLHASTELIPAGDSKGGRRVGVPKAEAHLTAQLARSAGALFAPGPGRSSWLILEPKTGFGIPDALMVQASSQAVLFAQRRQLRIPTLSAARVLAAGRGGSAPGLSPQHARAIELRMSREGWDSDGVRRMSDLVHDSLAIEVKLNDAKRALQQLNKFRVSVHRAAVCMPATTAHRASRSTLEHLGGGLIVADMDGVRWEILPTRREIPSYRRLWLAELLLRGIESETAHKFSASRNRAIALPSD